MTEVVAVVMKVGMMEEVVEVVAVVMKVVAVVRVEVVAWWRW
jgi:hypothetical protein